MASRGPRLCFIEQPRENITFFARIKLFLVLIPAVLAQSAADSPADMPALKLPGRAILFFRAELFFPAGCEQLALMALIANQKIEIAGDMRRDGPPALLVAVDGFQTHAQNRRQLFLSFAQFLAMVTELVFIH